VQLAWRCVDRGVRAGLMLIAAMFLWPGITSAEPISPLADRELAQTIQEAGYECGPINRGSYKRSTGFRQLRYPDGALQ